MKKIIIASIVLFALAGTAFGATTLKRIDIYQKENKATIYVAGGDISIYEISMPLGTCYVSYLNTQTGTLKSVQHNLSCIK